MDGILNVFKGMASGQQRLKNLGTFDEYIDRLVGEDDINNLTGRTREDLENDPRVIDQYIEQFYRREPAALADMVREEGTGLETAAKSFVAPLQETVLLPTLLPGGKDYEETFESVRLKNTIKDEQDPDDIERLATYIGKNPADVTDEDIEQFIYQHSPASNIGYGLGLIAEGPA